MRPSVRLVGIDCATQSRKVGLARGTYDDGLVTVEEVRCGHPNLEETVAEWLSGTGPALVALDAPLGWPVKLGRELSQHAAGQPLSEGPLFNRKTDRMIHKEIGRRPLDVGADRIARTARSALALLKSLRERTGEEIPLAWSSQVDKIEAIEVYPAATLKAHYPPRWVQAAGAVRATRGDSRGAEFDSLAGPLHTTADAQRRRGRCRGLPARGP